MSDAVRLSSRRLNRTLLRRQHLLERVATTPADLVHHLLGVQAQDPQGFYPSLAARLDGFDPGEVSRALRAAELVRQVTMRGTVHLHTAADAVALRAWTRPVAEREIRISQAIGSARDVDRSAFVAAVAEVLAEGPVPVKRLGEALAARFPGHPPSALGQLARSATELCQLPPRGCWRESGGVVYDDLHRWTGLPGPAEPTGLDVPSLIRRYLRAFGPARAADVTAWSGITRLGPVLAAMTDLVRYEDEGGRPLFDVPDGALADEDEPAPVRLLGNYDNLWLAHADRDRVTGPGVRKRWMTANGAVDRVVLVDGQLAGLWRVADGRVELRELFGDLTRSQRSELDDELARIVNLIEG